MTPTPLPSPSPTKTTAKTATPQPLPTATVTTTEIRTIPTPSDDSVWDIAQGAGAILAVAVALAALVITIKTATRDRGDADKQITKERKLSDARLQHQLDHQNERDRRAFVIAQLQAAGDLYAERMGMQRSWNEIRLSPRDDPPGRKYAEQVATQRLRAYLPAIPSPYASLMKVEIFGSHSPLIDAGSQAEAQRRARWDDEVSPNDGEILPIDTEAIYQELADNIAGLLGQPIPDADVIEEDKQRGE